MQRASDDRKMVNINAISVNNIDKLSCVIVCLCLMCNLFMFCAEQSIADPYPCYNAVNADFR